MVRLFLRLKLKPYIHLASVLSVDYTLVSAEIFATSAQETISKNDFALLYKDDADYS